MRLSHSIALSALLLGGVGYGKIINADGTGGVITDNLDTGTNTVTITKNGQVNLTSNTDNTTTVDMFRLETGASASFTSTSGNLSLDFTLLNPSHFDNTVNFNANNSSTITFTSSKNGGAHGVFAGVNTKLTATIANGAKIDGLISNDGETNITVSQGGTLSGGIRQTGGKLKATIEGTLDGDLTANQDTKTISLWANDKNQNIQATTAKITGNIVIQGGVLEGILKGMELQGNYTQSGGRSDIAFHHSTFKGNTTLSDAKTMIHFYASKIKSITATNGTTTINLKGDQISHTGGSTMESYTGNNGRSTIDLVEKSSMDSASQQGGMLIIISNESKIKGSITGSNNATLDIKPAKKSEIGGSIINSGGGATWIVASDSKIAGSISQTDGLLEATLTETAIGEKITQNRGSLRQIKATNSTISQGLQFTGVKQNGAKPQLQFIKTTIKAGGIHISNLADSLSGTFSNGSTINGGFDQTGRKEVFLDFSSSTLNDGVTVRDGGKINGDVEQPTSYATALIFANGSTLKGGVTSNNHSIWLSFNKSEGNGDITNTNGDIHIKATNKSNLKGNLISQGTGDTHLHLNDSIFTGNITQTDGKQTLDLQNHSKIIGNITNNNTKVHFTLRSNSELEGSYTQTNGTLNWILGGESIVHQDVTLNQVTTTLGNGQATDKLETFKGNLTQNGGTLKGNLEGLTLIGKFTQDGGETNIIFGKANFHQETKINNATLTKITFDHGSSLKDTTISGSTNNNNAFKLDHVTTLWGDFKLEHSKVTLSVLNGSKITGNIISNDPDNDLKLDFDGNGNEIGGNIEVKGGHLGGDLKGTTVTGKLSLTDAETHLHIINSEIKGGIDITRGHTLLTIQNSTIGTGFKMTGQDLKGRTPTLGLSINDGTKIQGNVEFKNTTVALGGFGDNNAITGDLISTDTTLTTGGDNFAQAGHAPAPDSISGLTIAGDLKQTNGSLDLKFTNKSDIQGKTTLDNGVKSHLTLHTSKINTIEINKGQDSIITLKDASEQNGAITLKDTKATIQGFGNSSFKGDITASGTAPTVPNTTIKLDASTLTGNITQTKGSLTLDYSNGSKMIGKINATDIDPLAITLDRSSITGDLTISTSKTTINMNNQSLIDGNLVLANNPSFTLNADASTLRGDITHTATPQGKNFEIKLNFSNNSTFDNNKLSISGNMEVNSTNSQVNSTTGMTLLNGIFNLNLSNSTGTIKALSTGNTNAINITTSNGSNSEITNTEITDNGNFSLIGSTNAILKGFIDLKNQAKADIVSLSNANLKIDINASTTSTLNITLNGGILEGTITQNPQASVGLMTLGSNGAFGGRWIATGDSSIKNFNIINSSGNIANEAIMLQDTYNTPVSLLDMTRDVGGISRIGMTMIKAGGVPQAGETLERTVRVGKLDGTNGVFRVYTDIGAEASDKISAGSATGNHIMQVYYNPATFTQDIGNRYIVVAHVDDSQTTASFEGGSTMVGTQIYKTSLTKVPTAQGGFDWILGKTQNAGANYGTKVISSILQSQYRSFALQTESLRQRMGELRDTNRVHGLWGRYTMGSTYTPESDVAVEIEDNFYSAWVGYDQNVLDLKGQNFFGFALSYSLLSPQGEDYTGSVHSIGFNFYNTFVARNDFYVDLVIKYILSMANYEISYYGLAKNTPEYLNHKLMLNAEIGKKFKLSESKNYFFLQPEAQITAGYIFGNEVDFIDFTQTTINSSTSGIAPVILRTGLSAGYSFNQGIKSDFYIGTSFFYETTNGGDVHLDDGNNTVDYSHKGTFKMSFQGGFDLLFTDNARVYFEAGTSFLGKTNTTYSINAGARFSFGYKNTRKLIVPSSITPPPRPQEPYDPRNIPVITDYTQEDIRNNNSAKPKMRGGGDDYFINTRKAYRDQSTIQKTTRSR